MIQNSGRSNRYICTYYGSEIIPPKGEEMEEVKIVASNFRTNIASFTTINFNEDLEIKSGDTLIIEQDRDGVTKAYLVRKDDEDVHAGQE